MAAMLNSGAPNLMPSRQSRGRIERIRTHSSGYRPRDTFADAYARHVTLGRGIGRRVSKGDCPRVSDDQSYGWRQAASTSQSHAWS